MQILNRTSRRIFRAAGVALTAVIVGVALPRVAAAQVKPDTSRTRPAPKPQPMPAAQEEMVQAQMAWMVPFMGQMTQVGMQSLLAALARPETAEGLATFTRNYYDALVAKGFTKEEALRIVIGQGIPMAPSPMGR